MPRGVPLFLIVVGLALLAMMIVFLMDTWSTPLLFLSSGQILMFVIFFTMSIVGILFIILAIRAGAKEIRRGRKK
jgi:hypothetical protein